jgi:hypothetical protein
VELNGFRCTGRRIAEFPVRDHLLASCPWLASSSRIGFVVAVVCTAYLAYRVYVDHIACQTTSPCYQVWWSAKSQNRLWSVADEFPSFPRSETHTLRLTRLPLGTIPVEGPLQECGCDQNTRHGILLVPQVVVSHIAAR